MSENDKLASKLGQIVGEANVTTDPEKLKAFAVDGLIPKVMAAPGTIEETSKLLAFACAEKLAVIPMGGGTKRAQGGIPKKYDIALSTKRMNGYCDYDIANLTVGVQCGATLSDVQAKLAGEGRGYFIPVDPQHAGATVGGIVATNDSGPKRFLYGGNRDFILGVRSVMPNGDITNAGGKAVKNVAGYDMTKLMIGSMGAVGIISEITFRITPPPRRRGHASVPLRGAQGGHRLFEETPPLQVLPGDARAAQRVARREVPGHLGDEGQLCRRGRGGGDRGVGHPAQEGFGGDGTQGGRVRRRDPHG